MSTVGSRKFWWFLFLLLLLDNIKQHFVAGEHPES